MARSAYQNQEISAAAELRFGREDSHLQPDCYELLPEGRATHRFLTLLTATPGGPRTSNARSPKPAGALEFHWPSPSTSFATRMDQHSPCVAYRWVSLPRNSATPTRG